MPWQITSISELYEFCCYKRWRPPRGPSLPPSLPLQAEDWFTDCGSFSATLFLYTWRLHWAGPRHVGPNKHTSICTLYEYSDTAVCDTEIAAALPGPHRYPVPCLDRSCSIWAKAGPASAWQDHPGPESPQIQATTPWAPRGLVEDSIHPFQQPAAVESWWLFKHATVWWWNSWKYDILSCVNLNTLVFTSMTH